MYGVGLSYGTPWDGFHRAILWAPQSFQAELRISSDTETIPSWSWASSIDPIYFPRQRVPSNSLAYWGRPKIDAATSPGDRRWSPLIPSSSNQDTEYDSERYVETGLAWQYGCVKITPPSCVRVNCTRDDYTAQLKEQWSGSIFNFWCAAFSDMRSS
jgi:hypothetical protein